MSRFFALSVVIVALGLAALNAQAGERTGLPIGTADWSAEPSAADTLRYAVRAGRPLIVSLPTMHEGAEATYTLLDAPSLSWMVDRSFMWRTTTGERGELPILIERHVAGAATQTIVLLVDVQP